MERDLLGNQNLPQIVTTSGMQSPFKSFLDISIV
jgi:hypothetical protein